MRGSTQGVRKLTSPPTKAPGNVTSIIVLIRAEPRTRFGRISPAEADRRDDGGPAAVVAALGGGRDVHGAHDLTGEQPLLATLVPRLLRIERYAQHGRQHGGRQVLGVLARRDLVLA